VRWRIQPAAANQLFLDYRDVDNIRDNLVTRELKAALNIEKANTRVAEQRAKTAEAEARANQILAGSVSNNPNVLVSKCSDATLEAGISPLGCWPGAAAVPTVPTR
jgi:hypothetical protein